MIVLIPAFEPDLRLVQLIRDLATALPGARVLVVDDGSGRAFEGIFDVAADAGAIVLRQPQNRGKGAALKLGFAWASRNAPGEDVVCADCDGQHSPADIARVAGAVEPRTMTLGGRRFTGTVPLRSRLGNTASRWVFRLISGTRLHDTQTGLRAYPADLLAWLSVVEGTRFEYEFNLLLRAGDAGVKLREVPIETIYLDENASSHFRPLRDSLRIYAPAWGFAASSLAGYVVDIAALVFLNWLTGHLVASIIGARLLSAAVNFSLNRDVVFRHHGSRGAAAARYAALAAVLLAVNAAAMTALVSGLGWPLLVAKVVVEASLFVVSYGVQRRLVFRTRPASAARATAVAARPPGPRVVAAGRNRAG